MARADCAWLPFLAVALALCVCAENAEQRQPLAGPEWDLLIFTQHWPVTVCQEWKEVSDTHSCAFPTPQDTWTIHGLWPTKLGTIGPQYCNRTWHFDIEEVKKIEPALNQLWINIEKDTSTYALWAHEWNKHGTCAAVLAPLSTQLEYFSQGLDWQRHYNMNTVLSAGGIYPDPDKQYAITDIYEAVKKVLNVDPIIECRQEDGISYIFEMRICFDKQLKLVDCEGVALQDPIRVGGYRINTNCPPSRGIVYPPKVPTPSAPPMVLVQLYRLVSWLQWFTL